MTIFTRDVYISGRKAVLAHQDKQHNIEIYYYDALMSGLKAALLFAGKAQKPTYDFCYKSEEHREQHVIKWLADEISRRAERKQEKAAKLQYQHTLKEGDLLRASWGYEQTNVDFYQVIAVKRKSVILQEIGQKKEYLHSMAGTTQPIRNHFIGEPFIKRVTTGNAVKMTSYSYAYPCKEDDNSYFSEYA